MKALTTSVYDFEKLISEDFLYVDKTAFLYSLIEKSGQYFLSRPRRFGKSLLVSTFKAIFQNRRDLFKGLAIDSLPYDWKEYPVIHLDMGSCQADTAEQLHDKLNLILNEHAEALGVDLDAATADSRFRQLVVRLAQTGKVVILIDEYDKPLLGHLGQESVREIQSVLKAFYSVVKTTEAQQRFAFITGVSKFSKVSIFSDLNNLTDITMNAKYATILGYTQEELESNFPDYLEELGKAQGLVPAELLEKIRTWYNGYRMHHAAETVYNPVSVMKCFQELEFKNYWFETGTPTFLVNLIKEKQTDLRRLEMDSVSELSFSAYDVMNLDPLPLLVQTGYLTIHETRDRGGQRMYRLGYPNFEIEQSFSIYLSGAYSNVDLHEVDSARNRLMDAIEDGDLDGMHRELRVFFENIPYDIQLSNEKYYQSIFFVIFKLLGAVVEAEVRTARGRIDAVAITDDNVFIFEFKLNDTAKAAMAQIHDKKYYEKYRSSGKAIVLIGAAFDKTTRNLDHWLVEELDA